MAARRRHRTVKSTALLPVILLALLLGACGTAGSSSGTDSPAASGSAVAGQGASVGASASPSQEPSPEPSDGLGDFDCSSPQSGAGTVARAQITDVRVGTHAAYDRVVFVLGNGIPEFTLEKATPPLLKDPSGLPLEVKGEAFWRLVMQGGTKLSPSGTLTYDGETDLKPSFPQLAELIEGGDFEAVSTWYLGLNSPSCVRVLALTAPSRLVIDIEH
jgi:hypothetical protein